jgi:propane monooxygenase small subunit
MVNQPMIHSTSRSSTEAFVGANSRHLTYFQPKGRRATVYEDSTLDIQPAPERHLLQGWLLSYADGTPTFSEKWTRIRASDWHAYRDPNQEWERTLYVREATIEKEITLTLASARTRDTYKSFDPTWIKVLEKHLSASKHAEYGLGNGVFGMAQRDAPSIAYNHILSINATDKLRYAQDLALYVMELAEQIPGFSEGTGKEAWLKDPLWQGARENIEILGASSDWAEQLFAANLVYEPLVGELFRSRFIMTLAPQHGDFVTAVLVSTAEASYDWNMASTREAYRNLLTDATYGAQNRDIVLEWLKKYVPLSVRAAKALLPIWTEPKVKPIASADAYERTIQKFLYIMSDLGIELPKEVQL